MAIGKGSKNKQIAYIVIIFLIVAVNAWIIFGTRSKAPKPSLEVLSKLSGDALFGQTSLGEKIYLPFGSELDDSVFSDERFLELVPADNISISQDDVGVDNPFVFGGATAEEGLTEEEPPAE